MAWVGRTDLPAPAQEATNGAGPIAQALAERPNFDRVVLLCNYPEIEAKPYVRWLAERTAAKLELVPEKLTSPTDHGEIYAAAVRACERVRGNESENTE